MTFSLNIIIILLCHFIIQIEEVREAYGMQMLLFDKSLAAYHVNTLIQMWNSRKPWIGDKTTVWSDLLAWRQTYYSFLISNDANSEFQNVKSAQVKNQLLYKIKY